MNLFLFLFQLNTSLFLQNIGLVFIQAIVQAPIYGLAVYWGLMLANKRLNRTENN